MKVSTSVLNATITGSQWRLRKRGVTWENFGKLNTRRAAAFWMRCKGLIVEAGSPARRELQETSDDERLDQDLRCFTCEEGPDLAVVVESNSTRSSHRGNVGVAGQLVIQYHAKVPCSGCRGDFDVLDGDK